MRKNNSRRQKKKSSVVTYSLIGLLVLFFSILSMFQFGLLGILLHNMISFLVGKETIIIELFMLFYGLLLFTSGKKFIWKNKKKLTGLILFLLGILIFMTTWSIKKLPLYYEATSPIHIVWENINWIQKNNIIIWGGIVGAFAYQILTFLLGRIGTYFISLVMIIVSIFLFFEIKWEYVQHIILKYTKLFWTRLKFKLDYHKGMKPKKKIGIPFFKELWSKLFDEQDHIVYEDKERHQDKSHTQDHDILDISDKRDDMLEEVEEIDRPKINFYADKESITHAGAINFDDNDSNAMNISRGTLDKYTDHQDYQLPSIELLHQVPETDQSEDYAMIENNIHRLEETFQSFGVQAKVVGARLGPSVTQYEVQPEVGVKVSRIVNLADDLALSLAAKDIRIEAPIPGKSYVGIEVPNQHTHLVSFRDMMESSQAYASLLSVPLGRDINGEVIFADLTKMPHLLIAGSTGSGKSVCINTIITGILMKARPDEVKLMMIDPKMVELNVYNGIPHLLMPVVTNPKQASRALFKVVEEMERRYELFAKNGMRNISGYNEWAAAQDNVASLPFIVVIVDELADLMMVASREVEEAITRLAQMARAAGIHMILATQRPSVDVITGIIKANIPSRIAFAVSSGVDSRTILDTVGAEKLLGKGDMLFLPIGENKPIRVQGAFLSDQEVENVVNYVQRQQEAEYSEELLNLSEEVLESESNQSLEDPVDELYPEAVRLVIDMDTASISLLQRRLRIGYNRAARLIDLMEEQNIVGPSEGSKPRKVLCKDPTEVLEQHSKSK